MFPDEYHNGRTVVEYLVRFFKPDLAYILDRNDAKITHQTLEISRVFLLSNSGTPSYFRSLCRSKDLNYEEVVEIMLRETFSEPNDIYWWLR